MPAQPVAFQGSTARMLTQPDCQGEHYIGKIHRIQDPVLAARPGRTWQVKNLGDTGMMVLSVLAALVHRSWNAAPWELRVGIPRSSQSQVTLCGGHDQWPAFPMASHLFQWLFSSSVPLLFPVPFCPTSSSVSSLCHSPATLPKLP